MMVSRTTKHRRFETGGGGEGRGGEGRGGVGQVERESPKRSEGDGFILHFPHKPLRHLTSLWGMGRNSVF